MSGIYDWATLENLQPEPVTVEIWRNLPEEYCRQVEIVNGQVVRCAAPTRTLTGTTVASIDIHVLDHVLGGYRKYRTITPADETSVVDIPVSITIDWSRLAALVR